MKVFILSDVRLYRDGLACVLDRHAGITVVGAVDAGGLVRTSLAPEVDVVLLDLPPPEQLKIVRLLRRSRRHVRILAIGVREVESEVLACAAAGIDGYIPVDAGADNVVAVLESAMRDELVCSPKVAASLYNFARLLRAVGDDPLTARELEVVELMNNGLTNKEIARRLGIGASTAKHHVQNILMKLKVNRRGQAVAKLRGLIRDRYHADGAMAHSG